MSSTSSSKHGTILEGKALEWMQGFRASKGSKYIKFEDEETKALQFFPDKEPEVVIRQPKNKSWTRTMWNFKVVDIEAAALDEDDSIKEWDVGPELADRIVHDYLERGDYVLSITRRGAVGKPDTKYYIEPVSERPRTTTKQVSESASKQVG